MRTNGKIKLLGPVAFGFYYALNVHLIINHVDMAEGTLINEKVEILIKS